MKEKYIDDLKEIKDMMNRSSRFLSLSGLSGVSTGITALIGAYMAYKVVFKDHEYLVYHPINLNNETQLHLLLIAMGTLVLSISCAVYFTQRKSTKQGQAVWDTQTKQLLFNLSIPLLTGGLLCLGLLFKGFIGLLPSLTLLFYGLALLNGSKYTLFELRNLGIIEIVIGLMAFQFIEYSLHFWALGFGVVQILYGLIIQKKYK